MQYWQIDPVTHEVSAPVKAEYRGGMYHIPKSALTVEPLAHKEGFAVVATFDENGNPAGSEYIEDLRGVVIYDKTDCTHSETVSELGEIKAGFTTEKPATRFDEWINDRWVTNESDLYIANYNAVDNARRAAYSRIVAPLTEEAYIKRHLIKTEAAIAEADELEKQALAARRKIQAENPWPEPPAQE
ncbi:hypothetical protein EHW61_15465 [Salinivibrio sp. VYel6]|uniref:hypothetical protein n=1 Tax=Salinivibrio sp. VYel6 TaxID=2490493 RepID=UPI00128CB2F4|nr:hypothetical protein [Salinivibrio sp. VYel6]MPX98032.1 hypothetical protein [Salinivibrio sp. VYel6]